MQDTPDTRTLAQLIAVELVVGGVTTLLARGVTDPKATGAINTGNFIAGLLGTVIAVRATLTGVMGWFGWVVTAVYLIQNDIRSCSKTQSMPKREQWIL